MLINLYGPRSQRFVEPAGGRVSARALGGLGVLRRLDHHPMDCISCGRCRSMTKSSIMMLWTALFLSVSAVAANSKCERLKATLTYTQEKAPRDLSSVLPVVVEKINRVLDGVVDVEVEWSGAELHGRVGEHLIKSTVTRLARSVASDKLEVSIDQDGREITTQCFYIPFTIIDTNECTLSAGHPMKHKCHAPSICVNTNGSYECMCPQLDDSLNIAGRTVDETFWTQLDASSRSPWELSFDSHTRSSCPGLVSTHGCCAESGHTAEGQKCRAHFHCPSNPCASSECSEKATCVRAAKPTDMPIYKCVCPAGLMGNGQVCKAKDAKPEPKVMFDGTTPTELTVKNNFYCGCTKPVVDACSGFPPCKGKHEICAVGAGNTPKCACKPGFVFHTKYGCIDENPPTLKLRHNPNRDDTLRLKQGDDYREYMVDIVDENAEDYLRSLKVSYSEPLPPGCLTKVGEFHVNYTVAMPWAKDPFVRVTRRVIIEDIDECHMDTSAFERSCPALVPQCDADAGAKCVNTYGSYECKCPSQSSGDGFKKDAKFVGFDAPASYKSGSSCVDTSKPVITLQGPNPKIFKICECGGLSGIMSPPKEGGDSIALLADQREMYEDDIKEMVRKTAGAELCATPNKKSPQPADCVKAVDRTYKGDLDLSDRVVVGVPIRKGPLQWQVPYNVKDDAGNEAVTVWRDVIVEEVELSSVESLIREEVKREYELKQQEAIDKALRTEKAKWNRENSNNNRNRRSISVDPCPACPQCECPNTPETTKDSCAAFCEHQSKSCSLSEESYMYFILFWLEEMVGPSSLPGMILVAMIIVAFMVLRFFLTAIFNPRTYQSPSYAAYNATVDDSSILRSPQPVAMMSNNGMDPPPPRSSMSLSRATNGNLYSSPQPSFASPTAYGRLGNDGTPGQRNSSARPVEPLYDESIYLRSPIITPSKTGDGVRRRNL